MVKILVPVDGSDSSLKAIDNTLFIAKTIKAEVLILSVVDNKAMYTNTNVGSRHGVNVSEAYLDAKNIILEQEKKNHQEMLDCLAKGFEKEGVTVRTVLRIGSPHEGILDLADEEKVDLIVIGSRGLNATKRFILGSVSEKVVFRAKCNVMVTKL